MPAQRPRADSGATGKADAVPDERQTEAQRQQGGSALNVFEAQYFGSAPAGELRGTEAVLEAARLILARHLHAMLAVTRRRARTPSRRWW